MYLSSSAQSLCFDSSLQMTTISMLYSTEISHRILSISTNGSGSGGVDEELSDPDGVELPSDDEGVSELELEESGSDDGISDGTDSGGLSSDVVVEDDSGGDEVGLDGGEDSDESGLEGVSEDTSDPEELPVSEDIPDPEEVGLLEASEEEGSCEDVGREEAGRDEVGREDVGREEVGRELLSRSGREIVLIREERLDSSCEDVS